MRRLVCAFVVSNPHDRFCRDEAHITMEGSLYFMIYEGGSICNENPFITPFTNALGLYAICQTKDQSIAVIMVQETYFYLYKFNKLQTF